MRTPVAITPMPAVYHAVCAECAPPGSRRQMKGEVPIEACCCCGQETNAGIYLLTGKVFRCDGKHRARAESAAALERYR